MMHKMNFKDYSKDVQSYYSKEGPTVGYLFSNSKKGINDGFKSAFYKLEKTDTKWLMHFFKVTDEHNFENPEKILKAFDHDKYIPIINFLKGKTKKPNPAIVEMAAILVDYTPRPFDIISKSVKPTKVKGNNKLLKQIRQSAKFAYLLKYGIAALFAVILLWSGNRLLNYREVVIGSEQLEEIVVYLEPEHEKLGVLNKKNSYTIKTHLPVGNVELFYRFNNLKNEKFSGGEFVEIPRRWHKMKQITLSKL